MAHVSTMVALAGFACLLSAFIYSACNGIALLVWRLPQRRQRHAALPPVSILKPLCGAEPGLDEDLRSFCRQDYPDYEIIFGVRDEADPACAIARQLVKEFPSLSISVIVDSTLHGSNLKISNLINIVPHAKHDILVMADSDACVGPDYLRVVTPPLRDPRIGLVTCIYRGIPTPGIWSRMGAMYINDWYVPSILLAWLFGHRGYVSGQTICIRRETLGALGGLHRLANQLADDHRLGTLVRGLGLEIRLSRYVVTGKHHEPSLDSVARHEVRWMRTLRVLQPRCFRWLFLTFSMPLAMVGLLLVAADTAHPGPLFPAKLLFAVTLGLRIAVHLGHRIPGHLIPGHRSLLADLWLLPARDLLLGWVWLRSFFTSKITWRGNDFSVDSDGVMHRI